MQDQDTTFGALRLRARPDLALVSMAVPLGGEDAVAAAVKRAWGLDLPDARVTVAAETGPRLMRMGPDQLLVLFSHGAPDAAAVVERALKGAAYVTDQTDTWVGLSLEGPDWRVPMERLCPLDLHDDAFPVGAGARTMMEHMPAIVVREARDSLLSLSAASSAQSFLHALETSITYTR